MARRPNRLLGAWAALAILWLAACGAPGDDTGDVVEEGGEAAPAQGIATLDDLHAAAQAEGEVEWWSGKSPQVAEAIIEAFNSAFPDIEVNYFNINPSDAVPRTLAEASAGRVSYDVAEGRLASIAPLIVRGLIDENVDIDWGAIFDTPTEAVADDGRLLVQASLTYAVAYNTDRVDPADVPQTWEDLLDPQWRGRIVQDLRGNAYSYLTLDREADEVLELVEGLREHEPIYVRGASSTIEQLAAGVGDLAVGSYMYIIMDAKRDGAPVDFAPISPIGSATMHAYRLKDSPNPNAAALFMGWLTSDEAVEAVLQHTYDGPMVYGPNPLIAELESAGVEVLHETLDNYYIIEDVQGAITDALGGT